MNPRRKGETPGWLKAVWEMKTCNGCGVVAGECLCKYIEEASMSKEFCYVVAFQENAKELYVGLVLDVVYYHKQEADFSADNPDDFYGYTEIEWAVARADIFDDNTDELDEIVFNPTKEYCEERFNVDTDYLEAWLIEQIEMEKEDEQ